MRSFFLIALSFLSIVIISCGGGQKINHLSFDRDKGKEEGVGDFVKLKSGKTITSDLKKFKIGMGLLDKKGSITQEDGSVQNMKDVEEFQMDSTYYKRAPGASKRFYQRIKSGKINVYYRHVVDRGIDSRGRAYNYNYDLYYLQKGNGAPVEDFSLQRLRKMISDQPAVSSLLKEYDKKPKKQKKDSDISRIIDTYNGKA